MGAHNFEYERMEVFHQGTGSSIVIFTNTPQAFREVKFGWSHRIE
jgi:hypothetical protein